MQLTLRFFASVREQLKCSQECVHVPPDVTTVGQLRAWLIARGDVWAQALAYERPLRTAVQQELCDDDEPVKEGNEIAFFPPVTGG